MGDKRECKKCKKDKRKYLKKEADMEYIYNNWATLIYICPKCGSMVESMISNKRKQER